MPLRGTAPSGQWSACGLPISEYTTLKGALEHHFNGLGSLEIIIKGFDLYYVEL